MSIVNSHRAWVRLEGGPLDGQDKAVDSPASVIWFDVGEVPMISLHMVDEEAIKTATFERVGYAYAYYDEQAMTSVYRYIQS